MVLKEGILKDIITLEDGFKYWWPEGFQYGAFASHHLREIADGLDEMNREWQETIEKDMSIADPR